MSAPARRRPAAKASTGRALNYSTSVPVAQTVAEVTAMLGEHGADAVQVRYGDRAPVGVTFSLDGPHGPRLFTLPVDVEAMGRRLREQWHEGRFRTGGHMTRGKVDDPAHHARVAWRVVRDWLEAQLALVAAAQAQLDQVMLPYLHTDDAGTTLYALYTRREQAAIEAGGSS